MTDEELAAKLDAFARDFDNVPGLRDVFGLAAARIRELSECHRRVTTIPAPTTQENTPYTFTSSTLAKGRTHD